MALCAGLQFSLTLAEAQLLRAQPFAAIPSIPSGSGHAFKGCYCYCLLRLGGRSCESIAYLSKTQLGELKIYINLLFKYPNFPHIRTLEYFNAGLLFYGLTNHLFTVPFNTYSSQVFFLPMSIVSIRYFNEDITSKFSQFLLIFLLFLNLSFSEGIA